MTCHAPSLNLVADTTTNTKAVVTAPTALISAARRQPRGAGGPAARRVLASLNQCLTMPAWESVKLVKTPIT